MLSQEMAQRIEHRKLAVLTPYPKNPRRHSDAQIAQIAGSIAQFGFNSPILIEAKGSIIAGHGRYLAALKLGLETAPVIILDHLSELEKRAYLLEALKNHQTFWYIIVLTVRFGSQRPRRSFRKIPNKFDTLCL